jgi:hypothetical protein
MFLGTVLIGDGDYIHNQLVHETKSNGRGKVPHRNPVIYENRKEQYWARSSLFFVS